MASEGLFACSFAVVVSIAFVSIVTHKDGCNICKKRVKCNNLAGSRLKHHCKPEQHLLCIQGSVQPASGTTVNNVVSPRSFSLAAHPIGMWWPQTWRWQFEAEAENSRLEFPNCSLVSVRSLIICWFFCTLVLKDFIFNHILKWKIQLLLDSCYAFCA